LTPSTPGALLQRPAPIGLLTSVRFLLGLYVVIFHFGLQLLSPSTPDPILSFFCAGFTAHSHHETLAATLHTLLVELAVSCTFLIAWLRPLGVNLPAWSLSCEVFFYLLFPLLVMPITRLGKRNLRILIVALAALCFVIPTLYLVFSRDHLPLAALLERNTSFPTTDTSQMTQRLNLLNHGLYRFLIYLPPVHLPIFLLGAALGRYRRAYMQTATKHRPLLALSVAIFLAVLFFNGNLPNPLLNTLTAVPFCFCMLFAESTPDPLRHILELRPLLLLGEASYAMYILQIPLSFLWSSIAKRVLHQDLYVGLPASITYIVVLILVSLAVYEWIERPMRLHIRKLAYGNTPIG
jgi:peptidoglycan/LPS O-acetylase OafA/YrhL